MNDAMTGAGADFGWARHLPDRLRGSGLADIDAECGTPIVQGGSPGAEFMRLTARQLRELMLSAGASIESLDAWGTLLDTPGTWHSCWPIVGVQGRRPQ